MSGNDLALARRAVRAAQSHVADATTTANRPLMRALGAQLDAVERALTEALYYERFRVTLEAAEEMRAQHTDACLAGQADFDSCSCRPPAVDES